MLLLLSVIYMAVAMVMTKDSNNGFKISASKPKISGSALNSQFQTDFSTPKRRKKKRDIPGMVTSGTIPCLSGYV